MGLLTSKTGRRVTIAAVLVLLVFVFLPPNINGVRFRDSLAGSLSNALGRQVKIGQVKYRILPRPGFELYDLRVMDDPAFSAEPLINCGKVTADLRLTSLWQGRLEIANLKLSDDASPASLNLVYANGHWNLESLLFRVEQVPSAPTAKRRAEGRPRFPYIEATSGRINLKVGPEKKPFAITNTDFAFWLAAEDVWHIRLKGQPLRSDMSLSDTGQVRLEGDLRRSRELRDMPVRLDVSWDKAQLGQLTTLITGRDSGWRGGVNAGAQLTGTPANLHVTASADLTEFRRYNINRNQMPRLRTRCLGGYVHEVLDLKCDTPLDPGGLLITAKWTAATPSDYDLSLVATRVPLSMLTTAARHTWGTLAEDLTASGDLNAAFGFHSHAGKRDWHGTGMTSAFLLQSAASDKPFPVSPLRFHVGPVESPTAFVAHKKKAQPATPLGDSLTVDPFSVQLGPSTTLEVQASVDNKGYWIGGKGMVPLERLLMLGQVMGFKADLNNLTASAIVDLNLSSPWSSFTAPTLRGTAHLQNVAAWIPGIKDRLLLSEADAQISEVELVLAHITGQFEHAPVAFTGNVSKPWSCQPKPASCPLEFDLHSDSLKTQDLATLLGAGDKSWNLPFFSESAHIPDFRATGTLNVGQFTVAGVPLDKFAAKVEIGDRAMLISKINARLSNGALEGEWHADWTTSTPHFSVAGTANGVALDRMDSSDPDLAIVASWLSGRADMKYAFKFEGASPAEMANNATGKVEYVVNNGISRALALDGTKPLRFQSLQGVLELEKHALRVLPSKVKAENRIYEMSGTVSLADKQAKIRLTSGTSSWDVTGSLEKPQVVGPPPAAQTAAARSR
jgi:hypothetical protein